MGEVEYTLVTDTGTLRQVCTRFAEASFVTVDTEFMRESTYWSKLCLIQMARAGEAVVIDPLAQGIDLAPFFELMGAEEVLKVFHAARQDVEIVVHMAGIVPKPMFDTQVAAMVCGYGDQVSYDQLVQRITGDRIDKTSRFTDWSRRPLSERQLSYAVSDVTHLREVYLSLDANLREQDRRHWVAEEMAVLTDPCTYRMEPEDAWRRLKLRVKKPRQLAVLQKLAAWREIEAQAKDVPRGRVLKDDAIYEVALQQPRSEKDLARLRSIPKGFEKSATGIAVVKLVKEVDGVPEDELPRIPRRAAAPEHASAAADLLKVLLKQVAEKHGVAPRVIANADELDKLASDDDADIPALKGWRREMFGETALKVKSGTLGLSMNGKRVAVVPMGGGSD